MPRKSRSMSDRLRLDQAARILLGAWMAGIIIAMFLVVPQYVGLGDAGRIIILHVPTAWVTTVAFAVSAVYSIRYLWKRRAADDAGAVAAAEAGFLFCALATVSGMWFANIVWGTPWNWDPRETTILILLLIYAAYFALRSALDDVERRRRLSAVYNLFAAVTMPFLLFVAPRMAQSTLHPNCAFIQGSHCDGIWLELNGTRIGQLGDVVLALQGIEQRGDLVVAQVEVRMPGLREVALLEPSFELASGKPADRPEFPGQQFLLAVEGVDLANGRALLNMEAPGSGLLSNSRTFWTFMAANIGFLGLFIWLYRLRADVLLLQERLARREVAYELPA
ncbi:cytochrome c biogenesis protein [Roseiflexus castenholzii]|uniref:Heme exporter protein C n=1 Tax=Roseiflexus castenholzii (strain DSM 13941 / HLO8) TaxID=383372 RepID=A7NSA7_ROSCS|nr:cytochrome c assembly protein [Roseiflexus castenholzii DSM 13941]